VPTARADCANYELNIQMCPCSNESCDNRGICCECLRAHHASGKATACMRGAKRDPATLGLAAQAAKQCPTNQARNLEFCVCTYEPCDRKGVCCNCVRNHFVVDGSNCVACMQGL
jgi:hypothetical protein